LTPFWSFLTLFWSFLPFFIGLFFQFLQKNVKKGPFLTIFSPIFLKISKKQQFNRDLQDEKGGQKGPKMALFWAQNGPKWAFFGIFLTFSLFNFNDF